MRHSKFWELMGEEFGAGYARSLARSHVLTALGGCTPTEALESGTAPREVWRAVCDDLDVPEDRRLGRDPGPKPR